VIDIENLLKYTASFEILASKKSNKPAVKKFKDGIVINGEFGSPEVEKILDAYKKKLPLIIADPPYGAIVSNDWDKNVKSENYMSWTKECIKYLNNGASLYMWGGIGKYKDRVFFDWLSKVEDQTQLTMRNLITWKKRRAYGKKDDYLFTREECAWLINGEKPKVFHIPLLEQERGYAGYNLKYPAKSKYLRRTNVWTDINELFKNKVHIAQKPEKLAEIMINTHTRKGDTILDPFAGSGSSGMAARKLGRKFILIEMDKGNFDLICKRLSGSVVKSASITDGCYWELESVEEYLY
jgi:site-specific DNA-methyltransferase (adenine-specific)